MCSYSRAVGRYANHRRCAHEFFYLTWQYNLGRRKIDLVVNLYPRVVFEHAIVNVVS